MKKQTMQLKTPLALIAWALLSAGCASTTPKEEPKGLTIPQSFLKSETAGQRAPIERPELPKQANFAEGKIPAMAALQRGTPLLADIPKFPTDTPIKVTANELEIPQIAHYIFGELLKLSYVLSPDVERMRERVALNLQSAVTPTELFNISRQLLAANNVEVYAKDNILYIGRSTGRNQDIGVGIGRELEDIPSYGERVIQLVPFTYNSANSIINILSRLTNVQASTDQTNRLLLLEGTRSELERALQVVNMMDVPHARGRDIRMLSLVYLSPEDLIKQLQDLMTAEGINVNQDISLVAISRLNAVVVYSANKTLGDRVSMWARTLDVATGGESERYYVYRPQFAKATDLMRSISTLLQGAGQAESAAQGAQGASTRDKFRITADEAQNAIIVQASPSKYHEVLGLLEQLDRMPGQVAMQVVIAEVDISNNVRSGIDWFYDSKLNSSQSATATLEGTIGSFSFNAIRGDWRVALSLLESRTNVKVLSRPYLVVRDGESANINSGRQVPVLVESVSSDLNPDVSRNSIQYRSTGISLSVTPIINADGLVSLQISQETSNSEGAGQGQLALAPVIVSRSVNTNILATDGQTVVLGGLIQETSNVNDNKVPFLGRIPGLGKLFSSNGNNSSRTELVVMITPRVIRETSELEEFGRKLIELYSFPIE